MLHLIWKHGESYSTIITLLGGFHPLCVLHVFQKIIFKHHGVIGCKDWFVDTGTIAWSAAQAIEGRHYFRLTQVHKEGCDGLAE